MSILARVAIGEGIKTYTAGASAAVPRAVESANSATFTGGAPVVRSIMPALHSSTSEPALRGHATALAEPAPFQVFTANPTAARRAAQNDVVYSAAAGSMVNRSAFAGVVATGGVQTFTAGSDVARRRNQRALAGDYDANQVKRDMEAFDTLAADETRAPEENKLGLKTIRDVNGNTIFEGDAVSKEALLAKMLKEEPNKSLAGADLSGMSLDHRHDLSRRNMTGANIKGTQFDGCPMQGTVLAESTADKRTSFKNLHNANGLDLSNMQTEMGMDGKGVRIENVKSAEMNLNGADLSGARISKLHTIKLEANHANMSGANISQWVAEDTQAQQLKANNLKMGGSVLHGDFRGMDISGNKTKVNDTAFIGEMAEMKAVGASFTGKNFFAGEFGKADFSRASFKGHTDMTHVTSREGPMQMHGTEISGIRQLPKDPRTTMVATSIKTNGFEFKPNDGKTAITFDAVKAAGEVARLEAAAKASNTITNLSGLNSGALRQAENTGLLARPDEDEGPTVSAAARPRRPSVSGPRPGMGGY